jgi:hypothetical protein
MRTVLHVLARPPDAFVDAMIDRQRADSGLDVSVADLNVPEPDYRKLLEEILRADSVEVW